MALVGSTSPLASPETVCVRIKNQPLNIFHLRFMPACTPASPPVILASHWTCTTPDSPPLRSMMRDTGVLPAVGSDTDWDKLPVANSAECQGMGEWGEECERSE